MDVSPILISMKTAAVSILVTFFLGVFCARLVVGLRSARIRMVLDGILTLPLVLPPDSSRLFPAVYLRRQAAGRSVFS